MVPQRQKGEAHAFWPRSCSSENIRKLQNADSIEDPFILRML